jgi:hypothetical protein
MEQLELDLDDDRLPDNWPDFVEWIEYENISIQTLAKYSNILNIEQKGNIGRVVRLSNKDGNEAIYMKSDDGNVFEFMCNEEGLSEWIDYANEDELLSLIGVDEEDLYIGAWECSIKDIEGEVYHWTTEEKWEKIQEYGGMKCSMGTGMSNRHEYGVFTSVDSEYYADGSYGDVLLKINLTGLKEDDPAVQVRPEPSIVEYIIKDLFAYCMDLESYIPPGSGGDNAGEAEHTAIIYSPIPIEYITRWED